MRSALIIPLVYLLFSVGCGRSDGIPKDVMPKKKMQQVIWDMMRADQFLNDYVLNKDSTKIPAEERTRWYQRVFAAHGIDQDRFSRSFQYYRDHPQLLQVLMDSINKMTILPSTTSTAPLPPVPDSLLPKRKDSVIQLNKKRRLVPTNRGITQLP